MSIKTIDDRVLDLVANGITDATRLYHILKAENWPEVITFTPMMFNVWLQNKGYTVDMTTNAVTL